MSAARKAERRRGRSAAALPAVLIALGAVASVRAESPGAEGPSVEVGPGWISIKAERAPLRSVLAAVSGALHLDVVIDEPLEQTVSLELVAAPVPDAIRRLLRDRSFVLCIASTVDSTRPPVGWLRVFAAEPGVEHSERLARSEPAGVDARRSSERVRAIDALGADAAEQHIDALERALQDSNRDVRAAALSVLTDVGGERAAAAAGTLLADREASLREAAVYALAEIGGATALAYLDVARFDADPSTRAAAADALAFARGSKPMVR